MTCLILVDMQEGFRDPKWGARNNEALERNVAACVAAFRAAALPVIHVRHDSLEADSPLRADRPGYDFLREAMPLPGERIFTKRAHGAFVGTRLERHLRRLGCTAPVFAGLTTDHCVSTSVRMAQDLGFSPLVIHDATATFPRRAPDGRGIPADEVHVVALASLNGEFARVLSTATLLDELSKNPSPNPAPSPPPVSSFPS